MERVGEVLLGKLKVLRLLGGGGMAAVYEVEHLLTGHRRALKVVNAKYLLRPQFRERLIREASVAGKLQTPYVVETFDAGTLEDGSAYVLMELLDGRTLLELMHLQGRLSAPHMASIIVQVCEGLAVAHAAGIIHRDLKPENLFLVSTQDGQERVKILDFGISKFIGASEEEPNRLTAEGTILGTPFYMSPEQASAKAVDERTDVYSIGVMMYEALTERLPFESDSVGALFIKIHTGECLALRHHLPDVDAKLEAIVAKAMHCNRDSRYASVDELRAALLAFAPSGTVARTRTLSEGTPQTPKSDPTRETIGYDEVRLESSPPEGRESSEPVIPLERRSSPASDAPGPVPAPPGRSRLVAAALVVVLGGVAGAALWLGAAGSDPGSPGGGRGTTPVTAGPGDRDRPSGTDPGGAAQEPGTAPAVGRHVERQVPAASPDAGAATAAPPDPGTVNDHGKRPTTMRGTPAEQAGLDPNPYGP